MAIYLNEEWSSQLWSQFLQLRKEAWKKIQDFNRAWTRDLVIGRVTKNKTSTTSEQSQQGTNDRRHYQHIPRERLKASCYY